jgi:hypothetical protein
LYTLRRLQILALALCLATAVLAGCGVPALPIGSNPPLPTPDSSSATVYGRLVGSRDGKAVVSGLVFLERATPEHQVPPILYAPPNTQPRGWPDDKGMFVISGVPDGEYVVVLYDYPDIHVFLTDGAERPLLVMAKSGVVSNLGVLRVTQ